MTWEATTADGDDEFHLPYPPSGKISFDFERGNHVNEPYSSAHELTVAEATRVERADSHASTYAASIS
jgi:hypothetical protein